MADMAGSGRTRARPHPPYDPELAPLVASGSVDGHSLRPSDIPRLRELTQWVPDRAELVRGGSVHPEERVVAGLPGEPEVPVLILWPTTPYTGPRPALLFCHGGGMVCGNRYSTSPILARWVERLGLVIVSVEYRLAPEHPYPAAPRDVRAVLHWMSDGAEGLGLDPGLIGVAGISAGAGLAAGLTLRARDLGGPHIAYQILQDPMLDDRLWRPSAYEHLDHGVWDRVSARTAWGAYLGDRAGGPTVDSYAAPARAIEAGTLAGLPPTYLETGSCDLFRDDVLAFGAALTEAGVPTELHLWPGGYHGFAEMAPHTRLGRAANALRTDYVARRLGIRLRQVRY